MGDHQDFQQTLCDLSEIKSKYTNNSPRSSLLWKKVMEAQAKKTTTRRNPTRNNKLKMKKRRRVQRGSRRATTMVIERKVRTLKQLIPNGDSSTGLDGLFRETAEYIANLQRRVKIMQAVVDALSSSFE